MGPFLFGTLTESFETQRAGIAAVLIFFVVGAVLLARIDEAEGVRLAREPTSAT